MIIVYLAKRAALYLVILLAIIVFFIPALYLIQATNAPNYSYGQALADGLQHVANYFVSVLQGNWGVVWPDADPQAVTRTITEAYVRSMGLLLVSLTLGSSAGILLGTIAAVTRRSSVSLATLGLSILGISAPAFFLAVVLQASVVNFNTATGIRLVTVGGFGWDEHLILPAIVLAARPMAQLARVTFVTLTRVLNQDYIRTALAKGLSTNQMLRRHALRNAAIPILTAMGVSLRFSLSTLPVVEVLFSWPGIGYRFVSDLGLLRNQRP
ncbi:MAG: ABC transporter permease, partial [Chloroflexi bacterium]|nr:ABC transporter permease [Chloroflexota bacterium]